MRVFIDVIQAFPSVMVALSLPLADRHADTVLFLQEANFDGDDVADVLAENGKDTEWHEVSLHFQAVMAGFHEDQWMSTEQATGAMASLAGCVAGVPLAGLIAIIAPSKITWRIQARLLTAGLLCSLAAAQAQLDLDPRGALTWNSSVTLSNL